jgi:hypothetical protein
MSEMDVISNFRIIRKIVELIGYWRINVSFGLVYQIGIREDHCIAHSKD